MLYLQKLAQLVPAASFPKATNQESMTISNNRYWVFYQGLRKNRWRDELEAAVFFQYAAPTDKGFRRLKAGLKERLITALLYSVEGSLDCEALSLWLQLHRQWAFAQVLWQLEEVNMFQKAAQRALEMAIVQQQFALAWQIAVQLHSHSSGDLLAWTEDRLRYCWEQLQRSHQLVMAVGAASPESQQALAMEAPPPRYGLLPSSSLPWEYLLMVQGLLERQQWKSVVEVCDQALQGTPFWATTWSFFAEEKAKSLYRSGQCDAAIEYLEAAGRQLRTGQRWWFQNRFLLAQIGMLEGDYLAAYRIWWEARGLPWREVLPARDQERWRLLVAHLELAARWGWWLPPKDRWEGFRLQTLLNDLPLHSQEKACGNLILWFLSLHFLLLEYRQGAPREEQLLNKLEALRKYRSRHLRTSGFPSSAMLFVQLWLIASKYWVNAAAFHHAALPVLEQLKVSDQPFEVPETWIPYSRQWEALLNGLQRLPQQPSDGLCFPPRLI
jgi:hypothetical protein